jgi:peptide/nickel transport system substrate-binding protein
MVGPALPISFPFLAEVQVRRALVKVRVSSAISITFAALAVSACARPTGKASSVTILVNSDEHVFSMWNDEDPKFLVFLPLVTRNARGELEGRLARSWEHSSDYRTWTIHLRSGIRWQDGVPVTAHDIEFTLGLMSRPEVLLFDPGDLSVTVLDDTTYKLVVHHGTVAGGTPLDEWTVYYPKHLLERLDPKSWHDWEFWVRPIGNGPYRYVRHVPKTVTELAANPDYYRGRPKIDRVVLRYVPPAITELLSGSVDAITEFEPLDLLKLKGDRRFEVYQSVQSFPTRTVLWNTRHPLLHDPTMRRALTLALDRRELDRVLNLPATTPIFDVILSERQLERGEVPTPLPYDPAEARRLLAAAGWAEVGKDGIRRQGGRPLRLAGLASTAQGMDRVAVLVQAQLRAVGVQLDLQSVERVTLDQRVKAGAFDVEFRAIPMHGFGGQAFFGPNSHTGYVNPRAAALLARAIAAMDPDEVDQAYRELAPIFEADLPVTFLTPGVRTTVAHRRLCGLSSPYWRNPLIHMDELWLEDRP